MIRSIVLNLVVGTIGLLFLAAGVGYAEEDTSGAGWNFLLVAFNLSFGIWCTLGAYRNLRARQHSSPQPLSSTERAAAVVAGVMALSLSILVACAWRAEGPNASSAPIYRQAGHASGLVFVASLVAVPIVAIWSSHRRAS